MTKIVILFLIILMLGGTTNVFPIVDASTSWILGSGGNDWSNNSTCDNTIRVHSTGHIELRQLVDDYLSYWRLDEGAGTTAYDENRTSARDTTITNGQWTSEGLYFDGTTYIGTGWDWEPSAYSIITSWDSDNTGTWNIYVVGKYNCYKFNDRNDRTAAYTRASAWYSVSSMSANSGWEIHASAWDGTTLYYYINNISKGSTGTTGAMYGSDTCLTIGNDAGSGAFVGWIRDVKTYNRVLTQAEINQTSHNEHYVVGNCSAIVKDAVSITGGSPGDVFKNVTIEGVNITDTWFHGYWNYSTDNSSFAIEDLGNVTTGSNVAFAHQTRYGSMIVGFNTDNATLTSILYNITLYGGAGGAAAPSITSYAPTATIWPEVQDSQLFNVTVDQSTQCRWYVNGTLKQTNATPSLTHAYTNTSLKGGGCNVTGSVNNTNGTEAQTWLFEVGADSIDMVILSEDQNNDSCRIRWNVTRIGSNVTYWNTSYNYTETGRTYHKCYDNGTSIINQTATSDNQTLWFNSTTLLPTGIYYINATITTFEQSVKTGKWQYLANVNAIAQYPWQLNTTLSNNVSYITIWNESAQRWNATWIEDWNISIIAQVTPGDGFLAYFLQDDIIERDNCVGGLNWSFPVATGYYLTGLDYNGTRTLSQINASIGSTNMSTITYRNETGSEWIYTYGSSANGTIGVKQGQAFWVYTIGVIEKVRSW